MKQPLIFAAALCGCLFAAMAQAKQGPGFTFAGGHGTMNIGVGIGAFWESNARDTAKNEKSGAGWMLTPHLSLGYDTKHTNLGVNAFYTMQRGFDSKNAQDRDSYGVNLSLRQELSPRWNLSLGAAYSRSEDDNFYDFGGALPSIDKTKSEHYNANAALGYRSNKWQASFGLGWNRTKQLTGLKNETDSYNASISGGKAIGPRAYWNVGLSTTWDDAKRAENSQGYYLSTGISGEFSKKSTYSVNVGLSFYDYSGVVDDTAVDPYYSISVDHKFNRTFAGALSFNSRYESEYDGNAGIYYVWSHNFNAGLNAQWNSVLSSSLNVAVMYEEHRAAIGADYERTYAQIALGSAYRFNDYVSLNGSLSYKCDLANGEGRDDTDDVRASVGLNFVF